VLEDNNSYVCVSPLPKALAEDDDCCCPERSNPRAEDLELLVALLLVLLDVDICADEAAIRVLEGKIRRGFPMS
jgi:hypothetical protein